MRAKARVESTSSQSDKDLKVLFTLAALTNSFLRISQARSSNTMLITQMDVDEEGRTIEDVFEVCLCILSSRPCQPSAMSHAKTAVCMHTGPPHW